jgi:CheY-like chemotaxis protein
LAAVDILYAEDSALDGEMTLRVLKKQNLSNSIVWVKDGQQALDYLFREGLYAARTSGNPCLILLDLKMPKVDGLEVLRRVKSSPALKSIPVVILTSSAEQIDLITSYELGVNSYIVKPVEFEKFIESVKSLGIYWILVNRTQ